MGFCIHDLYGFNCPAWATGHLAYIRFHGPADARYQSRYNLTHLKSRSEQIREFLGSGRDVYAYFNNDTAGHAVSNARELQQLLGAQPKLRRG
jgi:uncharacterized protein YecE (DUF72 family)